MNRVILLGNLGEDPELHVTEGGFAILKMRLATSSRKKDGDEWVDHTEWHNLVMLGDRAEKIAKFLSKGNKILVEGSLQTRKWEDKETGKNRYATEIKVFDLEFCDKKQSSDDGWGDNQ